MSANRSFNRRWIALAGACLILPLSPVRADSVTSLMAQLAEAEAEMTKLDRELPSKVQESLSLKKKNEADMAQVGGQLDALEAGEGASLSAQRPGVDAACQGTYPQDQLAAAKARCASIRDPYNARIDAYNARLKPLNARLQQINQDESRRATAAQQIKQRYESAAQRVKSLKANLLTARLQECTARLGGGLESESNALSVCFDNARRNASGLPAGTPAGGTWAAPNRTPEQAIKDYRDSGPPQAGTSTRRTTPPPPPPPPPKKP